MPVTWQTLVKCLRDTDLNTVADKVGRLLQQHKDSNRTPSEELESLLSEHKDSDKIPAEEL